MSARLPLDGIPLAERPLPVSRWPEASVHKNMIARCHDPKARGFKYYGGRGIKVCARWHTFVHFVTDMGPRPSPEHSIDRFPNRDGDYEPTNARWATRSEQARNKDRRPAKATTFVGAVLRAVREHRGLTQEQMMVGRRRLLLTNAESGENKLGTQAANVALAAAFGVPTGIMCDISLGDLTDATKIAEAFSVPVWVISDAITGTGPKPKTPLTLTYDALWEAACSAPLGGC